MFDPWRLRTLRELARRGTMTAAAEALSITPSGASQQLAALEREAGVRLIEPDGRRVRLTTAGRILARHAEEILDAHQAAADEVNAYERDLGGPLRIASFPTAAASLGPMVMRSLAVRFPNHQISLVEAEAPESVAALMRGDIDLAVVYGRGLPPPGEAPSLQHEELFVDPLLVLVPRDHRASRRRHVRVAELAEERWVMDDPSSSLRAIVDDLCAGAGFRPAVVASCRSFKLVTALVRAGCGVAILPGLGLIGERGIAVRPLDPAVERRVYGVCRRGSAGRPSIRAALDSLRETASQLAEAGHGWRRAPHGT